MNKSKLGRFSVYAVVRSVVSKDISANNLDEALATAKTMKGEDFVEVLGSCIDGDFWIQGVIEDSPFTSSQRQ